MMTKQQDNTAAKPIHWSFWLGFGFFVFVIVSLVSFAWLMTERLNDDESLPVSHIEISGDMPFTQVNEIERAIEQVNLSNFFNVDVNQVHQVVSTLPWVYSVAVRKQWPNELKIYVVDQKPVAIWNGDFLINQQGVAFQADQARLTQALPMFFGPEGSEITALENYQNLNKLLNFSALAIDELVLTERFAWQLTLDDGVTLNLGRENRVERVQRFMDVYPKIIASQPKEQQVNYVDLRYDTGLAVGWKAQENTLEKTKNSNKRA